MRIDFAAVLQRSDEAVAAIPLMRRTQVKKREAAKKRILMRNKWRMALDNMPYNSIATDISLDTNHYLDQYQALADCFAIKVNRISRNLVRGAEPHRLLHREILEKLGSTYGEQFAAIRLTALGLFDRYPYWPSQKVKRRHKGRPS